jgi:hypothetical protein
MTRLVYGHVCNGVNLPCHQESEANPSSAFALALKILLYRYREQLMVYCSAVEGRNKTGHWNPEMTFSSYAGLLAILAAALPGHFSYSQEVFAGGDQTLTDSFSASCIQAEQPNIWKQIGMNPLKCHAESAPQDSRGQCSLPGMTLLSRQGGYCYYCAPMNPPATLYIPLDEVGDAEKQNFSCGVSVVDPECMAVCTGTSGRPYIPPASQAPAPAPLNGQISAGDPCHPYYNMSTAAGRAAAQANAARDAAACNASRCEHNPQLPVCATLDEAGGSGGKGVGKTPVPGEVSGGPITPSPAKPGKPAPSISSEIPPVDLAAMDKAIVTCLKAKVSYAFPSAPQSVYRQKAQAMGPASVQSTPFGLLSNEDQVFVEAMAMSLQAQALHDQKYGSNEYPVNDAANFLTGYLVNCAFKAGIETPLTGSPFSTWANYIGVPGGNRQDDRMSAFEQGWFWGNLKLKPLPLMPPEKSPPPL